MKTKQLKLTVSLLLLPLLIAAATTVMSQQEPQSVDLSALAARGAIIAKEDPLALDLRNQASSDNRKDVLRGFDIGMGAAEGQTLPGPGKDKIRASLSPNAQYGFDVAVSFSLERNRHADLAAVGAAIARSDSIIANARNTEPDPPTRLWFDIDFYRLGFDIATGIFGDPALGAKGNTETGPGSLKIRDSLSPYGQRGFNASVRLLLGRARAVSPGGLRSGTNGKVIPVEKVAGGDRNTRYETIDPARNASAVTELRCRGGAGLRFVTIEGRTNSSGEQTNYMTVYFQPAARPAQSTGTNLQPGQCAFADRTVRSDEPYEIFQEIVYFGQLRQQLHGTAVDTSPTAAERFPDAQNVPRYLADARHYWSFFVRQNAPLPNGRFEASNGRYWEPVLKLEDGAKYDATRNSSELLKVTPTPRSRRGESLTASLQPVNSIKVSVRYVKEYGYRGDTSAFGNVGPTSCDAFLVSAALRSGRPENPIRISTDSRMADVAGNYVCTYLVSDLPLNQQVIVNVSMSSSRGLPTEVWKGGSKPVPPPGQERLIQNGLQNVTLTASAPRSQVVFDMVYAPISPGPR